MKKTLIAGAASVALAALPMAGVFAEAATPISVGHNGSLTDNFTVSIAHSCSMSRKTGSEHVAGSNGVAANNKAWNTPYADEDTLSLGDITSGAIYSMGSSTFNVKCNGTSGYNVTAYVTNFAGPGASNIDDINAVGAAISAVPTLSSTWTAVSDYEPTTGSPAYVTSTDSSNPNTVMHNGDATSNAGDDFTMTYTLGLKDGQASGSYTASVTYTLVDLTTN